MFSEYCETREISLTPLYGTAPCRSAGRCGGPAPGSWRCWCRSSGTPPSWGTRPRPCPRWWRPPARGPAPSPRSAAAGAGSSTASSDPRTGRRNQIGINMSLAFLGQLILTFPSSSVSPTLRSRLGVASFLFSWPMGPPKSRSLRSWLSLMKSALATVPSSLVTRATAASSRLTWAQHTIQLYSPHCSYDNFQFPSKERVYSILISSLGNSTEDMEKF